MENNIYFTQLRGHLFGLTEDERDDVLAFIENTQRMLDLAAKS